MKRTKKNERTAPATRKDTTELTIIVGVDEDLTGDLAWARAVSIATAAPNAIIHLCHVPGNVSGDAERAKQLLDRGERYLHNWAAARLFGSPLLARTVAHVRLGPVADALSELAVDVEADMIIVGTHGKGALQRIAVGSVARQLLERSPCPVMVGLPSDFRSRKRTPHIEPPPAPNAAPRTLGRTHTYHYTRQISLNPPRSTIMRHQPGTQH